MLSYFLTLPVDLCRLLTSFCDSIRLYSVVSELIPADFRLSYWQFLVRKKVSTVLNPATNSWRVWQKIFDVASWFLLKADEADRTVVENEQSPDGPVGPTGDSRFEGPTGVMGPTGGSGIPGPTGDHQVEQHRGDPDPGMPHHGEISELVAYRFDLILRRRMPRSKWRSFADDVLAGVESGSPEILDILYLFHAGSGNFPSMINPDAGLRLAARKKSVMGARYFIGKGATLHKREMLLADYGPDFNVFMLKNGALYTDSFVVRTCTESRGMMNAEFVDTLFATVDADGGKSEQTRANRRKSG